MFSTPVQVTISRDARTHRTIVELVAGDRPGLLFQVAKIFEQEGVALQNAKIATVGERAEDVFFVTTADEPAARRRELGTSRQSAARRPRPTRAH